MASIVHLIDQRRLIGPGGSTVSGEIYFYYSGTSVLAPVYTDVGLSIPSENPVSVGAGEIIPHIFLDSDVTYRRVIIYSDGTQDEEDPIGQLFSEGELGVPVGSVFDYPGTTAPEGFLLCYGQEVSRTEYPELFGAIGSTYGNGNGTTTFNVPDYRGRIGAGKDNMGGFAANRLENPADSITGSILGSSFGSQTHVLTEAQIPAHDHQITDPGHTHSYGVPLSGGSGIGSGSGFSSQSGTSGIATTGIDVGDTGGGQAHNNVQPTIIVNKIIKATPTTFLSLISGMIPDNKVNAAAIGIDADAVDMGTFDGTIVADNSTTKEAIQSLINAVANALIDISGKENTLIAGTAAQYYRGDKTWQTLNKSAVGLANVDNTSDVNKPVSTATQSALDLKAPLASPTFTGTVSGVTKSMVGLANVDNTSDLNKPVSTATQTALNLKLTTSTLALGTGAGLVGYTAPGTGGTLITQDAKNRQIIDPRDYGAVMNGSTDDRAALVAADAVGPIRLSKRVFVGTSMTFTNPVEFVGDGRIVVASGQTVTLLSGVIAQKMQIFGGSGNIAGLLEAWLEWFANDIKTTGSTAPSTDATSRLQAAMDSLATGGILYAGAGNWLISGSTAVTMHQGQSFWGSGYGPTRGTCFHWSGATRNLFIKTDLGAGIRGATIGNFRAQAVTGQTTALSSVALSINQSDVVVRDVVIEGAYTGVYFNTSYMSRIDNVTVYESAYAGIWVFNSLDVFIDNWNCSGDDIMALTGTPTGGAFVVGESVTNAGRSGNITKVYSATAYRVRWLSGSPATASSTVTATGKSATIASYAVPFAGGQIRFTGVNESCVVGRGDGVGGTYGLWSAGAGSAGRITGNSGYNVIEAGAYFDSTYDGSILDGVYGTEVNAWFATSRRQDQRGLALFNCRQITGSPRCENNAGSGIYWDNTSQYIYLTPRCTGNGRLYTLGNTADVTISGAAQNWTLHGGFAGQANMAGVSAPKSIYVDNAGAGNFSVIGVDVPNGSVTSASTADSQFWFGVTGVPTRFDKSGVVNAASDAAAASAGVPLGGIYRNGSVLMIRMA